MTKTIKILIGLIVLGIVAGGTGLFFRLKNEDLVKVGSLNITVPSAPGNGFFLTSTTTGAYVASSTQTVYFGNVVATTTTATSTFSGSVQIGATTGDNALKLAAGRAYPASVTVGGMINCNNGSTNTGPCLVLTGSSQTTGRLFVVNDTGTGSTQDTIIASSSCGNCTVLNIKGAATGKGLLKIEATSVGTGFSNSSLISVDKTACLDCQGFFGDSTGGANTAKWIQLKTNGTNVFDVLSSGYTGIASSTPWGVLSLHVSGIGAIPEFVIGSSTKTHFIVDNNGFVGIGTTSPLFILNVDKGANATTTVNIGSIGLSTSKACFNIQTSAGTQGSFYMNAAGTLTGELGACK